MKINGIFILAAATTVLTACGGDSGTDPSRPIDPAPLRITSTNQTQVARATVASGFAVARTSTVSAGDRATAQSVGRNGTGAAASSLDSAVRGALAPLLSQRRVAQSARVQPAAGVAAPAEACANGGTRTATFDDRDGNSATSSGDVVTVAFAGCSFDQAVLDGTMVMTVSATTGTTTLSGAMQFQHVKVTAGSVVTTITGQADVSETDTGSETDIGIVAGSAGLSVAVASPSYDDTISMSAGFSIATTASDTADGATIRVDGSFVATSLPSLDGALTVATLQPVVVTAASAYPTAGKLRVTDHAGGTLLLTVVDGTQVDLQLDANADGTFEGDTVVAWSALIPR